VGVGSNVGDTGLEDRLFIASVTSSALRRPGFVLYMVQSMSQSSGDNTT
jgi:hypothetical protein